MTDIDHPHPPDNPKIAHFRVLCWARARLWAEGEFRLRRNPVAFAVDPLQSWAERTGLVDQIGQDAVQAIMDQAFREVRDDL